MAVEGPKYLNCFEKAADAEIVAQFVSGAELTL